MKTEKEVRERFEEVYEQFLLLDARRDEMYENLDKYEPEERKALLISYARVCEELHYLKDLADIRKTQSVRFYRKYKSWFFYDYYKVEGNKDSKWVFITVNFDDEHKLKAAVDQHLIDQPEIRRAEEILAGCKKISAYEYFKAFDENKGKLNDTRKIEQRHIVLAAIGVVLIFVSFYIPYYNIYYADTIGLILLISGISVILSLVKS